MKTTYNELLKQATPLPFSVRWIDDDAFIEAPPTEGHPYFGRLEKSEILGDEIYPRKGADAVLLAHSANVLRKALGSLRLASLTLTRLSEQQTMPDDFWLVVKQNVDDAIADIENVSV